jgi:xylulokinase
MPVLGIDVGTQSLKAIILGDDLRLLGAGSRAYQPSYPQPGWAEQAPELWLQALRPAIGQALRAAGLAASDVHAVAVAGQVDGCIATDGGGLALAPAIIWMDRRATSELARLVPGQVEGRCGLVPDATHMAAKIAWFARHYRDAPVSTWHQPVSFVVAALSGERVIAHSLASTTMLYALAARSWDCELLDAFGVSSAALPRLAEETDVAGPLTAAGARLTGLVQGTPVVVGTGDDFSGPLGCGVTRPGVVAVSLGTAETVAALAECPLRDTDLLVETHAFPGGLYHLGNPGWLSGGSVRWACGLLGLDSAARFSQLAAEAPAGCDGLTFIPALNGAMAPRWIAQARGSFIGLSTSHGPSHLARAVLEGTAFAMRDVIDRLAALGVPAQRLRLMGGGARSALWCQIRVDVSGRPADVLGDSDASAVGAGLMAAVGAGIFPDIQAASGALSLQLRPVTARMELAGCYDDAYGRYRERFAALEPTWRH